MAQGAGKLKAKTPSGGRKDAGKVKKGKRVVPPKNKQRVAEAAQKKVRPPWLRTSYLEEILMIGLVDQDQREYRAAARQGGFEGQVDHHEVDGRSGSVCPLFVSFGLLTDSAEEQARARPKSRYPSHIPPRIAP